MSIAAYPTTAHSAGYEDKLLLPHWAEVVKVIPEVEGITTYYFKFTDPQVQARYRFEPGQFNMLYLPGYGESAISMSSDLDSADGLVIHTVRHVGNVTKAISQIKVGDVLGLRGPFGRGWPMEQAHGRDLLMVTGGLGCAPTTSAIEYAGRPTYLRSTFQRGVKHLPIRWRVHNG